MLLWLTGIFGAASKAPSANYFRAQNCKSNELLLSACQYGNCSAPDPFLLDLFICLFHYSYPQAKLQGSQLSPGSSVPTGESWVEVKPPTHCSHRFRCLLLWKSCTSPPRRNLVGCSPPWPFSSPSTLLLSSSPSAGCGLDWAGCSGEHSKGEGASAVASMRRTEPWREGEGLHPCKLHSEPTVSLPERGTSATHLETG